MNSRRSFLRLSSLATLSGWGSTTFLHAEKMLDGVRPGVTFFGAAGRVSGSMTLVVLPPDKILVDCGAFYNEGGDAAGLNTEMPAEALGASLLLLTHAHADHVGRITLLLNRGFKGVIVATEPTLNLLQVMLEMGSRYSDDPHRQWVWSARRNAPRGKIEIFTLHWHQQCKWIQNISKANKKSKMGSWRALQQHIHLDKAEASPCKECAGLEVEPIMKRWKSIAIGKTFKIGSQTMVTATEAGHLPGSVSYHLESNLAAGKKLSILFSGDLGPRQPMLQNGFVKPPTADAIVVECTYGASRPDTTREEDLAKFRNRLITHLKRGAAVWIPCFALDRTQKILMQIEIAMREAGSQLPRIPEVYVPSPSANDFNDLYQNGGESWGIHKSYLDMKGLTRRDAPSGFHNRMPEAVTIFLDALRAQEMKLSGFPDSASIADGAMNSLLGNIILTTSGMISEAFSEELFKPLARMESTAIFLVGYQDPESTGGKLKAAERDRKRFFEIDGVEVEIKAAVEIFSGFSGHANAPDIDAWLNDQNRDTKLFLVHGAPESLRERRENLTSIGWKNVSIPSHHQHFTL
jgi:metallo-beta-lactamase family protein